MLCSLPVTRRVRFWPIVLKKSKLPPQQNSRESWLISEFVCRCLLECVEGALVETPQIRVVSRIPKRQAHQRPLENRYQRRKGLFRQNRPVADLRIMSADVSEIS